MNNPKEEAGAILEAARQKANQVEREAKVEFERKRAEIAELETQACVESEQLIAGAKRQAEEKIRQAIEEAHAQSQTIEKNMKSRGDAILRQAEEQAKRLDFESEEQRQGQLSKAQAMAQDLISSAKKEVDALI